jgi:hypothetical protein
MNEQTKNYLGNGWVKTFENGGNIISLSLNLDKLKLLPVDNYGNVRVIVGQLKAINQKSKATHSVYEDTYKRGEQPKPTTNTMPDINIDDSDFDNLPF